MKHLWSIDKLVKKAKVLQEETSKNLTTALYSETTKIEKFFKKEKTIKNAERTNNSMLYKGYASAYNIQMPDSFNPALDLNILNLQLEIN